MRRFLLLLFLNSFFIVFGKENFELSTSTGFLLLGSGNLDQELKLEQIVKGSYYVELLFRETSKDLLRSEHDESIIFKLELTDGDTIINRSILVELKSGDLGKYELLFESPSDFTLGRNITIKVNDIEFNESFTEYYDEFRITVKKYSKYFR